MVEAQASKHCFGCQSMMNRKKFNSRGDRKSCTRIFSLRTWLIILVVTIPVYLFRIESIVYRELSGNHQRAEEDTVVAKALRYGTANNANNKRKEEGIPKNKAPIPVPRNGFLSRESLRSPIVASTQQKNGGGAKLTFDNLELELERTNYQNKEEFASPENTQQEIAKSPETIEFPRIVALNDKMDVTGMTGNNGSYSIMVARTMELDEVERQNDEDDESGGCLEFERPFYEECDLVMKPLPTIHPTCNSIHELSLTISETDSTLLSMKGSWRSVWKVNLDRRHGSHGVKHSKRLVTNDTLSSFPSNATDNSIREEKSPSSSSVVLKMLHLHRRFDRQSYEAHSTDIIVMDRLTASPYVVDAHGFCGQSVVTEFAESAGRDFVKRYDIGSRERMKIGRDLARGLADVQALQPLPHATIMAKTATGVAYDETPSIPVVFAHNDINIANTVMVSGRIKWNDFNIGVFMRQKTTSERSAASVSDPSKGRHYRPPSGRSEHENIDAKKVGSVDTPSSQNATLFTAFTNHNADSIEHLCPAPAKYRSDMWRSPEEIRNSSYVQMTQADVYGLANIFYQTMTRHQPWTYKEPGGALTKTDIANRKLNGTIPSIPEQYLNTTKRELQSLFAATNLCFFPVPDRRPTARRLAFGLGSLYEKLKQRKRITRQLILNYLAAP